jgi:hypothetical protein
VITVLLITVIVIAVVAGFSLNRDQTRLRP